MEIFLGIMYIFLAILIIYFCYLVYIFIKYYLPKIGKEANKDPMIWIDVFCDECNCQITSGNVGFACKEFAVCRTCSIKTTKEWEDYQKLDHLLEEVKMTTERNQRN